MVSSQVSYTERWRRRGGITQPEFLRVMADAGFQQLPELGAYESHAFTHPNTGLHRYAVRTGEAFSRAQARLFIELRNKVTQLRQEMN